METEPVVEQRVEVATEENGLRMFYLLLVVCVVV